MLQNQQEAAYADECCKGCFASSVSDYIIVHESKIVIWVIMINHILSKNILLIYKELITLLYAK